jgi:branched-chain amino acid transport system substrate-binding protein
MAAVGATGGLAAACGSDGEPVDQPKSGQTVRVGLVLPSAGPFARIAGDIRRGFDLYLQRSEGLLGPHTADVIAADEGTTAASALEAVTSLLEQRVVAIAGVTNPDALADIGNALLQAQVPLVSSNAAPSTLTNALFIWRASCVLGDAGRAIVSHGKSLGTKAYVFSDESTTGRAEAAAFRAAFQDAQGVILGESTGTADLAGRLQQAKTQGANLIFAAYAGEDAKAMLDAYRESGLTVKLLGPAALTDTVDLAADQLPANVYTAMFYASNLPNDANSRFVSSYYQRYGSQPTGYATAGYDSAGVLASAFALLPGAPTGATVNQAFSKLGQIDSPRGAWAFNINRSPQQRWYLRRLQLDGAVPANLLDADLAVQG